MHGHVFPFELALQDYDAFCVSNYGTIMTRTGAEVLGDIGAAPVAHLHDGQVLENDGLNSNGGAWPFTTTGPVTFNWPVLGPNGAVGAPSFSFAGDTDTGMYWAAANDVRIAAGGVDGISVTATDVNSLLVHRFIDGAVGAPGITFFTDPDTGIYRIGVNNFGFTVGGGLVMGIETTNIDVDVPIYAVDGAVGAPSYSFDADTNTGMYRVGNDQLGISAQGAQVAGFYNDVTANQILSTAGSDANPSYSFLLDRDTGMYNEGANSIGFAANGALQFRVRNTDILSNQVHYFLDGAVGAPSIAFANDTNTGFYRIGANNIGIALGGALDFSFAANTFNVLAGSNITMADDAWIGLGAGAGRIEFDNLATDVVRINGAVLHLPNGLVGAPSLSFTADTDTGMYYSATRINWAVGGNEYMYLNSTGLHCETLGVNIAPSSIRLIYASDTTITHANDIYGADIEVTRTGGASNFADNINGVTGSATMDFIGGECGSMYGLQFECRLLDGDVGRAGQLKNLNGMELLANANTGKIWGYMLGGWIRCIRQNTCELVGDAIGIRLDMDVDTGGVHGGTTYAIYVNDSHSADYTFWSNSAGPMLISGDLQNDSDLTYHDFGAGQDSGIRDPGTYLLFDCDRKTVGSRWFQFDNGDVRINSDTDGLTLGFGPDVRMFYSGANAIFRMLTCSGSFIFDSYTTIDQDCTVTIVGGEAKDAILRLTSDDSDDDADDWRIIVDAATNHLKIQSYASGAWQDAVDYAPIP